MPRRRLHPAVLLAPLALILAGCVVAVVVSRTADYNLPPRLVLFEGQSMEPTLHSGDLVFLRRYDGSPIARGDIVLFRFHLDDSQRFVKRVVALPGETVEVRGGTVYIDGDPLDEDYTLMSPDYTYGPETVPDAHYFVLGDNRRNSYDSHLWGDECLPEEDCDFVPRDNIVSVIPARPEDAD